MSKPQWVVSWPQTDALDPQPCLSSGGGVACTSSLTMNTGRAATGAWSHIWYVPSTAPANAGRWASAVLSGGTEVRES